MGKFKAENTSGEGLGGSRRCGAGQSGAGHSSAGHRVAAAPGLLQGTPATWLGLVGQCLAPS